MAVFVTDILSNGSQRAFRLEQWGANNEVLGHVYAVYEKGHLTQIDEPELVRRGFHIETSLYDLNHGWRQGRAEAGAHGNNGQVWQEACNLVGNSYALSGGIGETFHKLQHNARQKEAGLKEPIRIQGLSCYVAPDEYGQRCTYIEVPSFKEPGGVLTFKLKQTRNTVVNAEKVTGHPPEAYTRDYRNVDEQLALLEPAGGYPPGANVLSPIVAAITDMLDQTAPDTSTQDLLAYGTLERYLRNLSLPNNRPLSGLDQHWVKEKTGITLNKLEGVAGQAVDVADKAWKGISKVLESGTSPFLEFVGNNPLAIVVLGGGLAYKAGQFMGFENVMKNPLSAIISIALGASVVKGFLGMLTETGSNIRKDAGNCVKSVSDCLKNNAASPQKLAMQEIGNTV